MATTSDGPGHGSNESGPKAGPGDGWYPDPDFPSAQERVWRDGLWTSTARAREGASLKSPRDTYVGTSLRAPSAESMIRPVDGSLTPPRPEHTTNQGEGVAPAAADTGRRVPRVERDAISASRASVLPAVAQLDLSPLIAAQNRTTHAVRAIARVLVTILVGGLVIVGISMLGGIVAASSASAGAAAVAWWTVVFSVASAGAALVTVIVAIAKAREELEASEH